MRHTVGALSKKNTPRIARATGGIEVPHQIGRVGHANALPVIDHLVKREEDLDVVDRADHDLPFGLADVPTHRLAESSPDLI